jgi:hypothetical protein
MKGYCGMGMLNDVLLNLNLKAKQSISVRPFRAGTSKTKGKENYLQSQTLSFNKDVKYQNNTSRQCQFTHCNISIFLFISIHKEHEMKLEC